MPDRAVYMNAAAEHQVKAGNALRIVNNQLLPTDPETRAVIANAIDKVAKDETETGAAGYSLAIPDTNGAGYIATLLPLEQGLRQSIMAPFAASVAMFVQDPAQVSLVPGEAFARLHQLTGGELRVAGRDSLRGKMTAIGSSCAVDKPDASQTAIRVAT